MSSCHSSIGTSRCHRLYSLRFLLRGLTASRSNRTRIR
jgi:hypothetical protein